MSSYLNNMSHKMATRKWRMSAWSCHCHEVTSAVPCCCRSSQYKPRFWTNSSWEPLSAITPENIINIKFRKFIHLLLGCYKLSICLRIYVGYFRVIVFHGLLQRIYLRKMLFSKNWQNNHRHTYFTLSEKYCLLSLAAKRENRYCLPTAKRENAYFLQ